MLVDDSEVRSATPRERSILRRATWLLDTQAPNDPEYLREVFLRTVLPRDTDVGPKTLVSIDDSTPGHVAVTLTLVSALDWDRLHTAGLVADGVHARLRPRFRDAARRNRNFRDLHTLVRALAIRFLSAAGGGIRSFSEADGMYCAEVAPYLEPWDRKSYLRVIRGLVAQYGPLG